jgi:hypothetical protein
VIFTILFDTGIFYIIYRIYPVFNFKALLETTAGLNQVVLEMR